MIKALIFDFFGVLYPDTYNEFVAKHASELSPEDQDQLYELHVQSNRGRIDIAETIEQMARLVDLPAATIQTELHETEQINADLVQYIAALKPRYKIGLLSNVGKGFLQDFFIQHNLDQYFDATTLSCDIGSIKPEKESYQLAAEALEVAPVNCLMIDDKQRNIDGAEATGMPGLLYENFPQFKLDLAEYLSTYA
jgi:HAD superfamily hydrolase (TIGR01509 family)